MRRLGSTVNSQSGCAFPCKLYLDIGIGGWMGTGSLHRLRLGGHHQEWRGLVKRGRVLWSYADNQDTSVLAVGVYDL